MFRRFFSDNRKKNFQNVDKYKNLSANHKQLYWTKFEYERYQTFKDWFRFDNIRKQFVFLERFKLTFLIPEPITFIAKMETQIITIIVIYYCL